MLASPHDVALAPLIGDGPVGMIDSMSANTTSVTENVTAEVGASRWSRLASVGLTMQAAAPLLMLVAGVAWGLSIGEDLPFFLLPAIAGLGAARLVRSDRTLWKVVAIILGVLIAVMLFWTAFGLVEPASFFDFVPGVLIVGGLLVTLIAGIGAIRSRRDGVNASAPNGERRAIRVVLAALAILAVASGVASVLGRETVSELQARNADFVVDMKDFEFDQDAYEADGETTILVKNSDPFLHTFTVDELDIDVELTAGSEKLITIPGDEGTYVLYCRPHTGDTEDPADDDMAATLQVG